MLATESLSWNGLLALRSRLDGRLSRYSRSAKHKGRRGKRENNVVFFESDLRLILEMTTKITEISEVDFYELDRNMQNLLSMLNDNVNKDWIMAPKGSPRPRPSSSFTDLASLGRVYPQFVSVLHYLDSPFEQVNLTSGPGVLLFKLPHGEAGSRAMTYLADCKSFLNRVSTDVHQSRSHSARDYPKTTRKHAPVLEMHTSIMVNKIFKEFRKLECKASHDIRLRVPMQTTASVGQPTMDMFISSCLTQNHWQETRCDSISVQMHLEKSPICSAILKSKEYGRLLHLLVVEDGVFDVTDEEPVPSPYYKGNDYIRETLGAWLKEKRLRPMSPTSYFDKSAKLRFETQQKTALALALAKCLMAFFDGNLELASYTWNPDKIFFFRASQVDEEHHLYISLRPAHTGSRSHNVSRSVQVGDPTLLAFARLLLEIMGGKRITLETNPRGGEIIGQWATMCDMLAQMEKDGRSCFLDAAHGCLYLHNHLRSQRQPKNANISTLDIKKAIYENVVKGLELELDPDSFKEKQEDSPDDDDNGSTTSEDSLEQPEIETKQLTSARLDKIYYRSNDSSSLSEETDPTPRSNDEFEVAILCALAVEYNAISLLMDEIWDDSGPRKQNHNDSNAYVTGRIGGLNAVLVLLSNIGKVSAASSASKLLASYPKVKFALLTGICGGVPQPATDEAILLGDVIIGKAAIQYDQGRLYPDGLVGRSDVEDSLGRLPNNIRSLVTLVQTDMWREKMEDRARVLLKQLQSTSSQKPTRRQKYRYPGSDNDILYEARYRHKHHANTTCACSRCFSGKDPVCPESHKLTCAELGCDQAHVVDRDRLQEKRQLERDDRGDDAQAPSIFVGRFGSGDWVLKSGEDRDEIAREHNLLAFETEAAGIWDEMPCVVIKGVCDYADSHKNKIWQAFASATAACVAKAFLERVPRR